MTIKIKNEDVVELNKGLKELAAERMPVATALQVRKVLRAVRERLEDFEMERQKLLHLYAEKDENGKFVHGEIVNGRETIKLRDLEAFNAGMRELLDCEFELTATLTPADLGAIALTPETLLRLGAFIADE